MKIKSEFGSSVEFRSNGPKYTGKGKTGGPIKQIKKFNLFLVSNLSFSSLRPDKADRPTRQTIFNLSFSLMLIVN